MIVMRVSSGNGNYAAGVNASYCMRSVKEASEEDDVKSLFLLRSLVPLSS